MRGKCRSLGTRGRGFNGLPKEFARDAAKECVAQPKSRMAARADEMGDESMKSEREINRIQTKS